MPDSTKKDFGDFLLAQLGNLEPRVPYPPRRHTQTPYICKKPDTWPQRGAHVVTDAQKHTQKH